MMILLCILGAIVLFGAGYLTCAIRVAMLSSEEWEKQNKND